MNAYIAHTGFYSLCLSRFITARTVISEQLHDTLNNGEKSYFRPFHGYSQNKAHSIGATPNFEGMNLLDNDTGFGGFNGGGFGGAGAGSDF